MLLPHSSAVEITDTQSSGRFGWNCIYLDQVNVIKTETYLYDLILILCGSVCCNLYIVQPARFGAGCYIEMALSYHQPHQHELVGG